jgi:hypothetical protein
MTTVFGNQSQAGIYNSASAATQNQNITARAAADAAQAILGYQTTEQGIADTATQQLGSLLSGTTTNTEVKNSDTATTAVQGSSSATIVGSSSSSQSSGLSVICTFMFRHHLLDKYRYRLVSHDLMMKPSYEIKGYLTTVAPLVRMVERNHFSLPARMVCKLFAARTEYVCACYNAAGCKKKVAGRLALAIVWCACAPASLYHFFSTPVDELVREVGA